MMDTAYRAIAIVGVGAILPDAPNARAFWENVKGGRYSISEVSPERWDPALYYDPDPAAPDKTYSKIGGWVREYPWDPAGWRLPIPPRVAAGMDGGQKWGIACTREALEDYGYPARAFDPERTAVILGNAMAGEKHYLTSMRIFFPEYARELAETETFAALPPAMSNCIAGRIANLFNFRGPNYVVDAACASAMAAISSAAEGLMENDFDVAITGGIDRNMGPTGFIKFSKIGALSATGSRPFDEGADGFVMGEGAAVFIMKRLVDAERDGDRIYAVLRAIAGSSDGKGKGITAPNPVGQKLAIQRAWRNAGVSPATAGMMEAHGTSTRVGDRVEAECLVESLRASGAPERTAVILGNAMAGEKHYLTSMRIFFPEYARELAETETFAALPPAM
ncbi:MAG: polyketide synthase, partial [Acidobacteriia bacterium]|nr:polyketide synthase [Terriglobia bacterium]